MAIDYGAINVTKREALFGLLADGEWHSHVEIAGVAGVRYSARILELKRLGYMIDSEDSHDGEQGKRYRMLSTTPGLGKAKRVKVYLEEPDVLDMVERGIVPPAARAALEDAHASFNTNRDKL